MAATELTFEFGLNVSLSNILLPIKEIGGYEVLISYGGGMGGSHRYLYSTNEPNGDFSELKLIDGENIKVNKNFIVTIQPCRILTIVYDTTKYWNYADKTPKYKKVILTMSFYLYNNETYTVSEDFTMPSTSKEYKRKILTLTEREE